AHVLRALNGPTRNFRNKTRLVAAIGRVETYAISWMLRAVLRAEWKMQPPGVRILPLVATRVAATLIAPWSENALCWVCWRLAAQDRYATRRELASQCRVHPTALVRAARRRTPQGAPVPAGLPVGRRRGG